VLFSLLTTLPCLLLAAMATDIKLLVSLTGSYAGLIMEFVLPSVLVRREHTFANTYAHTHTHARTFTHTYTQAHTMMRACVTEGNYSENPDV
jgi:hypothetical protein